VQVLVTNTSFHPDFEIFNIMLSSPNQNFVPFGNGNIIDAISKVITSSTRSNSTNISSNYLKVCTSLPLLAQSIQSLSNHLIINYLEMFQLIDEVNTKVAMFYHHFNVFK